MDLEKCIDSLLSKLIRYEQGDIVHTPVPCVIRGACLRYFIVKMSKLLLVFLVITLCEQSFGKSCIYGKDCITDLQQNDCDVGYYLVENNGVGGCCPACIKIRERFWYNSDNYLHYNNGSIHSIIVLNDNTCNSFSFKATLPDMCNAIKSCPKGTKCLLYECIPDKSKYHQNILLFKPM